jgi:hypothetical protein
VIKYESVCLRDKCEWYASYFSVDESKSDVRPKGWYSLLYILSDDMDETIIDTIVLHILRGSSSAHFVGVNSHEACLTYSNAFDKMHDLSTIARPLEPLCSFSESKAFSAEEAKTLFWGGHIARDYGSHEGSIVVHSSLSAVDLRPLIMSKW